MKKKLFITLISLLIFAICATSIGLISWYLVLKSKDGGSEKDTHTHRYAVQSVKEPTCTGRGYTTYACECGKSYIDSYIDALGHNYGENNICTRCGYLMHEHEYTETVIAPTCTEEGYIRGDCNYCTAGYFIGRTDPLGHDYVDGKCTRCGEWKPTDGLKYTLSADGSYYSCAGIGTATDTRIVIAKEYEGKPVKGILKKAFYGNWDITHVTIPDTVISIGESAFEYCVALTEISVPDSVTAVGKRVFYRCEGMLSATVGGAIGEQMFQYCIKLETAIIRDGVIAISEWAFGGCENLETVKVPDSVTSIGADAFYKCEKLKAINIPDGVPTIGDGTFFYCISLTELTIPDSVKSIGENAFLGLEIRSATIPMGAVKNMSENYHVTYLATVIISSGEAIYEEAFNGWKITSITLPASVTVIGSKAFLGCPLTDITYNGTVEQWNTIIKSEEWDYGLKDYTVHCTNGDILFEAN